MPIRRRHLLQVPAALALTSAAAATRAATAAADPAAREPSIDKDSGASPGVPGPLPLDLDPEALRWLDRLAPPAHAGVAWGWPWPRGQVRRGQAFALRDGDGRLQALQGWPLAWWPDGSVKWSGHALPPATTPPGEGARAWRVVALPPGKTAPSPLTPLRVEETADAVIVDTGVIRCTVPRRGDTLVASITRGGVEIARELRLIADADDAPDDEGAPRRRLRSRGELESVDIEQRGPHRAVLRLRGRHRALTDAASQDGFTAGAGARAWLPFDLRLYLHAGGDALRIMHSWVFDGDPQRDFPRGLGLIADVPLRDPLQDRHLRFAGAAEGPDAGLWGEAVRGLTGLRRDPGAEVRAAQLEGRACPPDGTWQRTVRELQDHIPAWGDFSLTQHSPDAFQIRKRTRPGHTWIHAADGARAAGLGYVGGPGGGLAFGLRDFWQRHPAQLEVRGAHTGMAQVRLWWHSPDAPAMDLRPYHDGLGQHSFEQQRQGLEVTYEDYEPGFDSAVGVGRSHEITLFALAATPGRERLLQLARLVQTPPQLVAAPRRYLDTQVFGPLWSLPDRGTPANAAIEDRLDSLFDFYRREAEQRRWTGFWDHGDIRHTYDADRHEWRYDVGGFAWDNSELSPDLWLWVAFLRSGRADIFRFAEAMVRHTSEVDTYHLGRFQGLGTRHGVLHWSDSAKQLRISTAAYRRHYHYLTADERIGDVLHALREADRTLITLDPGRKLGARPAGAGDGLLGVGTDWGALLANWLTEWERSGDPRWRERIRRGMASVAAMPHGFFSAATAGYELESGALIDVSGGRVGASHLSAVFGLAEMAADLIALVDVPGFEDAWLQYCVLFNAPVEEQRRALGAPHGGGGALRVGHSRLTAYAAWRRRDAALAARAWREFLSDERHGPLQTRRIAGPAVLRPVDEAPGLSTNEAAQWALAAIQNLALIGEALPAASA
ncbi:Tat pathway signal sequence domain protein [Roseateles sp.]|uniref:exo-rhamnogalacturonan lyase family protein n=1 Tax=Roseateles sp. TaxID=1971397 RepID=UPI0031D5B95B